MPILLHGDVPTLDPYKIYGRVREDEETVDYVKHKTALHMIRRTNN